MTDTSPTITMNENDALFYTYEMEALTQLRNEAPWTKDAKYFQNVVVSLSALMKMMTHCVSGVDKGIQKGGKPIEVMGLLFGRPMTQQVSSSSSPENTASSSSSSSSTTTTTTANNNFETHTLLVSQVFPLPIEGFETRVVADDIHVSNHMIALGESLERQGRTNATDPSSSSSSSKGRGGDERFMGWYHSHPFDYMGDSHPGHCYLSNTDVTTQLQWQRMEDPHGNPFVAIVLDPLRSVAHGVPELKAFRAYPPEYTPPMTVEGGTPCPDGRILSDEKTRLEQWGHCWNRYYELNVEYFMSSQARIILDHWKNQHLWMRHLVPKSRDSEETRKTTRNVEQWNRISNTLSHVDLDQYILSNPRPKVTIPTTCECSSVMKNLFTRMKKNKASSSLEWDTAFQEILDYSHEVVQDELCQMVKEQLFST